MSPRQFRESAGPFFVIVIVVVFAAFAWIVYLGATSVV